MTTNPVAKPYVVWSYSKVDKRWRVGRYNTLVDATHAYEQIKATTNRVKAPCPLDESVDPNSNAALLKAIGFAIVLAGTAAYWYLR
jgi:hypothetical protein